jgi:hypothetical protein
MFKHLEEHWSKSFDPSFFCGPPLGQDAVDVLSRQHHFKTIKEQTDLLERRLLLG